VSRPHRHAVAVAVAVIGSIATSAHAAKAPAPGASCSPAGATRTVKGTTLTCTTRGKKAVWIAGAASASTTTSTTTTLPADSVDHKGTMIYGVAGARLTRRASTGSYFETDSRPATAFSAIRQKAYAEMNPPSLSTSHPNVEFVYDIRPSFPAALVEYTKRELDLAAALWNHVFETKIRVRVALMTEQDRAYITGDRWYEDNLPAIFSRFDPRTERPFVAGGGGYWQRDGAWTGNIYLATASYLDLTYVGYEWPEVARHEFFHVVQDYALYKDGRPRASTRSEYMQLTPQHFREGGANAVGYLTAFRHLGWSSDAMHWLVWERGKNHRAWMSVGSADDAVRMMVATERDEPEGAFEMSYAIGAVMYEWVIGTYGLDGFTRLLGQFATAASFDQALQRSLGLTQSDFYAKVAPYVYETFAAANR